MRVDTRNLLGLSKEYHLGVGVVMEMLTGAEGMGIAVG